MNGHESQGHLAVLFPLEDLGDIETVTTNSQDATRKLYSALTGITELQVQSETLNATVYGSMGAGELEADRKKDRCSANAQW